MAIDFGAALRRRKIHKTVRRLRPRPSSALLSAHDAPRTRFPLVLDTNVYIADAAGILPPAAGELVDRALLFHCSVCLAELAVGIANADPRRSDWPAIRDHYREVMDAIPASRILVPNQDLWIEAGLVAGTLARIQGLQAHQRKDALNDALIYLTAMRHGLPVLTSNRQDFDFLEQLAPGGLVYVYEAEPR